MVSQTDLRNTLAAILPSAAVNAVSTSLSAYENSVVGASFSTATTAGTLSTVQAANALAWDMNTYSYTADQVYAGTDAQKRASLLYLFK